MKKIALSLLAFAAALSLSAQGMKLPEGFIPAKLDKTYVEAQGSYTPDFSIDGKNCKVKNVILLIGDGLGLGATASAYFANGGELTMTNLRTMGYSVTQSSDDFTTDSAASGTAYATGHKTKNGALGMDPEGNRLQNIPELLTPLGYACGVVSTDEITGATPAAFFAHQNSRHSAIPIWEDLGKSPLVFASAGSIPGFEKLDLQLQEKLKKQFTVVYSPEDKAVKGSERLAYFPPSVSEGRGDYLPKTTQMAIDYLSQRGKKGFFLMVEGARIDKYAHGNNLEGTVKETLDFDKAVEVALRFAEKDGHTLVVISADHETGAIVARKGNYEENYVQSSFASPQHSPMMVPLYAYGPQSGAFMGYQQNNEVALKIIEIFTKGKVSGR